MTRRGDIVATAQAEVGTTEVPPGSNRTKYGAWYGLNGQPYCAIGVAWVYARNGHDLRAELTPQWAYTPAGLAAGRRAGWAVKHRYAREADIVFFNFRPGGDAVEHVGIVTANLGDRGLATIEFNTSSGTSGGTSGSQSNGGGVYARTRPWSVVVGMLSPPYLVDGVAPPRPPQVQPVAPVPPLLFADDTEEEQMYYAIDPNGGVWSVAGLARKAQTQDPATVVKRLDRARFLGGKVIDCRPPDARPLWDDIVATTVQVRD